MEAKRKRNNIIIAVLLLALAAGMIALPTLLRREEPESADAASILSAIATAWRSFVATRDCMNTTAPTAAAIPSVAQICLAFIFHQNRTNDKGLTTCG